MQSGKPLLNNRYAKVKRLGEGTYGTVYLAIDTKPEGGKRKADPKALAMLDKVVTEPYGGAGTSDVPMKDEEQKEVQKVLSDRAQVFQQNDATAATATE